MKSTGLYVAFAAFLATAPLPAFAVELTACGQSVPERERGILTTDLDCSSSTSVYPVWLSRKATLDMAGHTIIGSPSIGTVRCDGPCTIEGDGMIVGGQYCVHATTETAGARSKLRIFGLTVSGCEVGVLAQNTLPGTNLVARELVSTGNTGNGIEAQFMKLRNVVSTDNGRYGLRCGFGKIVGRNVTVTGNGLAVPDSYAGVHGADRINLRGATVSDNSGAGVRSWDRTAKLKDSTATGNSTIDIYTAERPKIVNTACGTSAQRITGGPGPPWGVCEND